MLKQRVARDSKDEEEIRRRKSILHTALKNSFAFSLVPENWPSKREYDLESSWLYVVRLQPSRDVSVGILCKLLEF